MDLFEKTTHRGHQIPPPLADRVRPDTLDAFVGQDHLVGPGRILRRIVEGDTVPSMILWGPPGVGKTTLARLIARNTEAAFFSVSAVTTGLADIRKIMQQAVLNRKQLHKQTILFIDEIHRFNKAQQDGLLHSVEDGTLILIGATTENPSFEVIAPLLSRCRVLQLQPLGPSEIRGLLLRALTSDAELKSMHLTVGDEILDSIVHLSGGDGRVALNGLELACRLASRTDSGKGRSRVLTPEIVQEAFQKRLPAYDKKGDGHYDTISAFIKSLRGSDPDGAVYWLARMLEAGEDPLFIARRMVILASEDVGNSDPMALVLASAAFQAVHAVGLPESRIILSQAATYLASAPKSNAAYIAVEEALEAVRKGPLDPVPLHLRNAVTGLMKEMGYGAEYAYAHDHPEGFVEQEYLPERLRTSLFYRPKEIGEEKHIGRRLRNWWKKRRTANPPQEKKEEEG